MTRFERLLSTAINYLVERLLPNHAFIGKGYMETFTRHDPDYAESGKPGTAAAASFLMQSMSGKYTKELSIEAQGLTLNSIPQGDWELIVRQTRKPD